MAPPQPPAYVYLDHAGSSPVREVALAAWLEATQKLRAKPGNPNALHGGGRAARLMLEDARAQLADVLGADRAEVVFSSGATESVALGILGAARGAKRSENSVIAVSALEHPAVADQRQVAEAHGFGWWVMPSNRDGVVTPTELPVNTAVASLALVCSETGVVQPVEELVEQAARVGAYTHTDATQAIGNLPVDFSSLGVDMLSLGGHKFGAPIGTGALLVKRGVRIVTDRPGGGQERQLRSGTQDVAGAVALAAAAQEAASGVEERRVHYMALREQLLQSLPAGVHLTTTAPAVPSIVHLHVPTAHPEVVLLEMDRAGIAVSAGSACHAGVTRPSDVLLAMGRSDREARGALRVSFGPSTTGSDVHAFVAALPGAVENGQRIDQYDQASNVRKGEGT